MTPHYRLPTKLRGGNVFSRVCLLTGEGMVQCGYYYHLHMQVGNVFSHVCLSVCVSVCVSVFLSVFLSVQDITFEPLDIELHFWYACIS